MGAIIDCNKRKSSAELHLNAVPFIDVMSCLTAFLLATAILTSSARLDRPIKQTHYRCGGGFPEEEPVQVSVLVTESDIWVGLSRINSFTRIQRAGGAHDWDALYSVLEEHKRSRYFEDRDNIEIAVDDTVPYATMVTAMDTALAAGFADLSLHDPDKLSARVVL